MGETGARREGTLGGFISEEATCAKEDYLPIASNFGYLNSFSANKLKYVHGKAFGYKICKLSIILEEPIVVEKMNGEKKYGF